MNRSETNRAYYQRNRARLQERARERKRKIAADWRVQLAAWDAVNSLDALPPLEAVLASGVSEWAWNASSGVQFAAIDD